MYHNLIKQILPLRNQGVVVVHWASITDTGYHVYTYGRVMCIANNFAAKQTSYGVRKCITTSIKIIKRRKLAQSFAWKINWTKALTNHREARISSFFNPFPFMQMHHLSIVEIRQPWRRYNQNRNHMIHHHFKKSLSNYEPNEQINRKFPTRICNGKRTKQSLYCTCIENLY